MSLAAGIFAAGDGTRLRPAHPGTIKPMVQVGGRPLVHWVAASLRAAGVRRAALLVNSRGGPARDYLAGAFPDLEWRFLTADTASSWESFRLLCGALAPGEDSFLVSTVDALVPARETARFAAEAARDPANDAALALTEFVDDEKPLWADVGRNGIVTALGPDARRRDAVTCGLYWVTRRLAASMPDASAHGDLRGFWTAAVRDGRRVAGVALSKTLDVDRPEDLAAAEHFVPALLNS